MNHRKVGTLETNARCAPTIRWQSDDNRMTRPSWGTKSAGISSTWLTWPMKCLYICHTKLENKRGDHGNLVAVDTQEKSGGLLVALNKVRSCFSRCMKTEKSWEYLDWNHKKLEKGAAEQSRAVLLLPPALWLRSFVLTRHRRSQQELEQTFGGRFAHVGHGGHGHPEILTLLQQEVKAGPGRESYVVQHYKRIKPKTQDQVGNTDNTPTYLDIPNLSFPKQCPVFLKVSALVLDGASAFPRVLPPFVPHYTPSCFSLLDGVSAFPRSCLPLSPIVPPLVSLCWWCLFSAFPKVLSPPCLPLYPFLFPLDGVSAFPRVLSPFVSHCTPSCFLLLDGVPAFPRVLSPFVSLFALACCP